MSRVLAGKRAVLEALARPGGATLAAIYVDAQHTRDLHDLVERARQRKVPVEPRTAEELERLSGGVRHQGVVAIGTEYTYLELEELVATVRRPALLVALDEITDPHNFGAILRSGVALGADGVITMKQRAAPITPVVVRVSTGATEHARIARVTNLSRALVALREEGFQVVGLDAAGDRKIEELPAAPAGRVLVLGSEGRGLRRLVRESCDMLARIELRGPIESLNASVAAGIAIYEAARLREREEHDGERTL